MKLLLHSCCAPCSGAIIEHLTSQGIRPTVFFSNSNITPSAEYDLRLSEIIRYAEKFGLTVINDEYDHQLWLSTAACGREDAPERGARCLECFRFRLLRAAEYASKNGYDTLTTTLASSRWKSLDQVNEAGLWACSRFTGVQWWGENWRKGGLQERRSQIIREQNFYNQQWCGCEFSHRQESPQSGR